MKASEERMHRMAAQIEAADWFLANREGLDAVERGRFVKWLKSSPTHVEEYLAIAELNAEISNAANDPAVSLDALLKRALTENDNNVQPIGVPSHRLPDAARRTRWGYVAAAAMVTIVCLASWWWHTLDVTLSPAEVSTLRFATRHGEQLTERLADGSIMHLNTDTSVSVRYATAERRIDIERGQVEFEVTHDIARPFRVFAGPVEVVAVGTVFDVYLQADSTLVTVVEGRVRVGPTPASILDTVGTPAAWRPVMVAAGQQVRVVRGELLQGPSQVDPKRATAWLHRQIVFEREPLARVIADFNRYSSTPVEIESPELRGIAISGAFAADDTESFVAFLSSLEGVSVQVTPNVIRVSKR